MWWAQDGAPPHRTVDVGEFLTEFFGRKIIAIDHPIEWPPRSPDLTPCDFFLWGYLKAKCTIQPLLQSNSLSNGLRHEADELRRDPDLVRRAVRDMVRRVNVCLIEMEDM